jgi:hypothetical protein
MQARSAFSPRARFPPHADGSRPWITDLANVVRRLLVRDAPTRTDASSPSAEVRTALQRSEMVRARVFSRAILLPCAGALALHLAVGRGDPLLYRLTTASLVSFMIAGGFVWWSVRRARAPASHAIRVFGAVSVVACFVLSAFLGVLSPAGTVIVVGISFFALGDRLRAFRIQFFIALVAYLTYGMLVSLGYVADRSLLPITGLPVAARVGLVVLTASLFVVASLQARTSRVAMESALEEVQRVTLEMRQRESQLAEARHHLDVAFGAWRDRGRYTGMWAGRFVLDEIVGRGAIGEVYAAADPRTGELAAVKLMRADVAGDARLVQRFLREARIAATLRSPYLVALRDAGQMDDGSPFIAMELLHGSDLGARLRREDRLAIDDVLGMAHDIGAALDVAHRAGVIHRDLKPQNVFHTRGADGSAGCWKVLDFGVCALRSSNGTLTNRDMIGTPHYMSPEQVLGYRSDHRADVFAMGVLLYRVLTGQLPFSGDAATALYAVVYESPPRPSLIAPRVSLDVERVLALALAKSADHRIASATELADALRRAVAGALPRELRQRADALVVAAPWGRAAPNHPTPQ